MKTRSLIQQLYKYYPKSIAEANEDFVGLMVGKLPEEVNRIMLCLDFDESIFLEAVEYRPDLIITHHPFFYGLKSDILKEDKHKKDLYKMLNKYGFNVFSIHTNFDGGTPGMNDALAKMLDLQDIYTPIDDEICMRIGYLKSEMPLREFVNYAKKSLHASYGLLIDKGPQTVKKVGIVGGGGSRFYKIALKEGCDIYISGDVSHHTRREMIIERMNYLDLPHEIERAFMPQLKEVLLGIDSSLDIKIVDHEKDPIIV